MLKKTALAATVVAAMGATQAPASTIVEAASGTPMLSTLVTAVKAAGLVDTLAGDGPFTVFAPTNTAFGAISDASLAKLLKNKSQLSQVLTCHVVAGEAFSRDVAAMIASGGGHASVETVGGCTLTAYMDHGKLRIRDENGRVATVTMADLDQSNGVVHVIDSVIIPGGQVARH